MPDRAVRRSFIGLHLTLGVVAIVRSAQALLHAAGALVEHQYLVAFGVFELLAALLFLWPRTMRVGGAALVAVFVHEALFQASRGDFPAAPLVYAAAALFVTVHGDAWRTPGEEAAAI
ncbi:MAG TPA: hypothetical protein VM779_01350 [Thermoanaerobaculia bacterium]|nr:hypothetical protein [Thermoanaerobaculia bacterium]